MDEKRKTPRRRVLKEGKIIFADGLRMLDCTIRDMSKEGAKLLISSTVGIPQTFDLFEKSTGLIYPATVAWRQMDSLGVRFDAEPTNVRDPENRRYARLRFL
jgi:PilZ domain